MKKSAPHLPAQSCSVPLERTRHTFKWLVLVVALSVAAGATASLVMIDYWYPVDTLANTTPIISRGERGLPAVNASVVREWRYRMVKLYDESRLVGSGFYPEEALVGHGVVLSSSGWTVLMTPAEGLPTRSKLIAVDTQGVRHPVETVVNDPDRELSYLKLAGSEFRATTIFGASNELAYGQVLWAVNGEWQPVTVGSREATVSAPYRATDVLFRHQLAGPRLPGHIVVTERGDMVGIVGPDGHLIPAWLVEYQLPELLANGAPSAYRSPWRGYFVEGVREAGAWKELSGFYVESGGGVGVRNGDVVVKIQNELVSRDRLAHQILRAPNEFKVVVLRAGEEVEITLVKNKK